MIAAFFEIHPALFVDRCAADIFASSECQREDYRQ